MAERLTYQAQVCWVIILAIESLIIMTSNIIAITIFSKRNFVVCKSAYLLISLTIADILVGVAPLLHLAEIISSNGYEQEQCGVSIITDVSKVYSFFTILMSLSCLAIIALERSFATFKPHRHRRTPKKHYIYVMTMSWCTTIISTVFKGIITCNSGTIESIFTTYMTAYVAMCILLIIVPYVAIAVKMTFFSKFQSDMTIRNNAKLSKTLMITTLVAVLTNIPRILFRLVGSRCLVCLHLLTRNADLASNAILYSNSFANLFIYSLRMPVFRKEFKKVICKVGKEFKNVLCKVFSGCDDRVHTTD